MMFPCIREAAQILRSGESGFAAVPWESGYVRSCVLPYTVCAFALDARAARSHSKAGMSKEPNRSFNHPSESYC